jgi:excisionase family DNA binding protein
MTSSAPRIPRFFTIKYTAENFDVCEKTVRRWIKSGQLPSHTLAGAVRISEADLVSFAAARRR